MAGVDRQIETLLAVRAPLTTLHCSVGTDRSSNPAPSEYSTTESIVVNPKSTLRVQNNTASQLTAEPGAECWSTIHLLGHVPQKRAAHTCEFVSPHKLYLFGGWNGNVALNDMHVFDLKSLTWSALHPPVSPPHRNNHASAVVGKYIFIHGGHDGTKWLDDIYVFDTETEEWTELHLLGPIPQARACHTLTHVNNKLYMLGGYDGSKCFSDLDVLDLSTMSWSKPQTQGDSPQARNAHTVSVRDKVLIVFGGHSGDKHLTDLHFLDTATLTWHQPRVSGPSPPGLRGHTANMVGDRLVVFGGYDGQSRSKNVYVLDTLSLQWTHPRTADNGPHGRQKHTSCAGGQRQLVLFGGFDGSQWLNDMYILDVAQLTETELPNTSITQLINDMKRLFKDPVFADVKLRVKCQTVNAHRCILALRSQYFSGMFLSRMMEDIEGEVLIPEPWSYAAIHGAIEFMYTGSISSSDPSCLCEMMGVSDLFQMPELSQWCQARVKQLVDRLNVCAIIKDAHTYQVKPREVLSFAVATLLRLLLLKPSARITSEPMQPTSSGDHSFLKMPLRCQNGGFSKLERVTRTSHAHCQVDRSSTLQPYFVDARRLCVTTKN